MNPRFLWMMGRQMCPPNLALVSLAFCGQDGASSTGTPPVEEGQSTWKRMVVKDTWKALLPGEGAQLSLPSCL